MGRVRGNLTIGFVLLFLIVSIWIPSVSAHTQTLEPGIPFEIAQHADSMEYINYSWSVSVSVYIHFVVLDPQGAIIVDNTSSSYDSFLLSLDSGDYTFIWNNTGDYPVTLTYDVVSQSTGVGDDEHIIDTIFLGLLVGAVVVVIIIVLVVVVVVRGGRKAQHPVIGRPGDHAPPGEAPSPFVPGMCQRCGSPFDSQHTFCPKCGHRVR